VNGIQIKKIFNYIFIGIIATCILFGTGYCFGFRRGTNLGSSDGFSATESVGSLKSEIARLKSENERLTTERDQLISDFATSNDKLESIRTELQRYSKDIANQSIEYSGRIEKANGDILEFNRIYTERVFKLCDTMEGTINTIAAACGYDLRKTE
jgi:hypothetical protein